MTVKFGTYETRQKKKIIMLLTYLKLKANEIIVDVTDGFIIGISAFTDSMRALTVAEGKKSKDREDDPSIFYSKETMNSGVGLVFLFMITFG